MGWARMFLLGDIGQQLDIHEAKDSLDRMRRSSAAGAARDFEQDQRIEDVALENEQLKLCLIALVRLLVAKSVLAEAEVKEIVNVIDPPPPPQSPPGTAAPDPALDDLIALSEAAKRRPTTP